MAKNFYNTDIETIKANLIDFFDSQEEFKDYNFDGSATTELMNLMAYTVQYQFLYLNFNSSEFFMDTLELEDNAYKLANTLNYIPKRKSAALITVELQRTSAVSIIIPKFSEWELGSLKLTNLEDITINDDDVHTYRLYEGTVETELFVSDGTDFQTYELLEREEIDNDNMLVFVDPTDGAGGWTPSTEPWENVNTQPVNIGGNGFYIHYFEKMNIKFDSGDRFAKPQEDDQVRIVYLKTSGTTANGATGTITIDDALAINEDQMTITPIGTLGDGTDEEVIDSIKLNAPQFYTTQNRAVTEKDYNILFKKYSKYDTFHSGIIWGGEKEVIDQNNDLQETTSTNRLDLGHIYVTACKENFDYLTDLERTDITDYLEQFKIITLFFRHMYPTFLNIYPTVNIKYASNVDLDVNSIETSINDFLTDNDGFGKTFYLSDLIRFIDALSDVVYTTVSLLTSFTAKSEDHKVIRLNGAIVPSSVSGTVDGLTMTDDGAGNIVWDGGNIGTINTDTGYITIDHTFVDETYEIYFEYVDISNIPTEKELFLRHQSINLSAIIG